MNRRTLFYIALPIVLIAGAATFHRTQRNNELKHQAAVKGEGTVAVTLVSVQAGPSVPPWPSRAPCWR
ncbi:MAG: hypothetical protein IPP58_01875 [Holophagaceae bacterium]|uniref:Uncharacterized protein n=1 Tax=Candidatus Geothrix skivensis TaxID=2954439 RepID=A0A9D7SE98_9BACT|nr:hypothetical protein [Candidatus Geothrix skivensis]